jgi:hypothetical protein
MNKPYTTRTVLALSAVAALVVACGGESPAPSDVQSFVARITPDAPKSDRLRVMGVGGGSAAAAATAITNAQLFQWAQLQYPEIFGTAAPTVISNYPYEGKLFDVRDFKNGAYLGVADGRAYGLGPFTNGALVDFGPVQQYAETVCSKVDCTPTGGGGGTGSLNGCVLPASEALRTGNRYTAVYVNAILVAPLSSGEHTVEGVVDGPTTFEGQSVIKVTNTVKGFQSGQTVDATVKSYEQIAANDLIASVGADTDASFAGVTLTLRTVFNPVSLNDEFTLQPGQSFNKTISSTSTYVNAPIPLPPTTGSGTTAITYEARETITVLGRSYDTCRYKDLAQNTQTPGYTWYIYGKGLPARQESLNAAGVVIERTELKSATINGAPL